MDKEMYLLLTREQEPVAKGVLESGSCRDVLQLKILEGDLEELEHCEVLCLIGSEPGEVPVMCKLTRRKEDRVVLKKMMTLDPRLRRTYRVPAGFKSFIYPIPGSDWTGRLPLQAMDMSCGGFAFYSTGNLREQEIAEVVIPNITHPVMVRIQILRKEVLNDGRILYGTKFLYACPQEEQAVFRSVFSIQIDHRRSGDQIDYKI